MTVIAAHAPGRVNLIGDHTDYSGGLVCPMAVDLGTTVVLDRSRPLSDDGRPAVQLVSAAETEPAVVPLDVVDPASVSPPWARYVAGVVAVLRPAAGGRGTVTTTLPVGGGLSSSAALEVAIALVRGADPADPVALARSCQRAEQLASGVPCGIMDQLASAGGVDGHVLLIDCTTLERRPLPLPDGVEVLVVDSGEPRTLAGSAYAERRAQVEAAATALGLALRDATPSHVEGLSDAVLRRRARHVVSENARVLAFAEALTGGDLRGAGQLMVESHESLRSDFGVSTPTLDALVARLVDTPGVWGARLTGGGFGGCVVALTEPGVGAASGLAPTWVVHAAAGARLV